MPAHRCLTVAAPGVFVGLALSTILSGQAAFASRVSPDWFTSFASLHVTPAAPATAAATRMTASDKQKVPKPASTPSSGGSSGKSSGGSSSSYDSSDDSDSDCFSNCFVGFGESLVESPTPPPPPGTALEAEESRWAVGSSGWLFAPSEVDSVGLWDAPADPEIPGVEVGRLPHGTQVIVTETHAMATGFWLKVRPFDAVEPTGWVPSSLVGWAPEPKPAPPRVPKPDPTWGIRVVAGYSGIGPADLDLEYSDGGTRIDLQYVRLLKKQWISGAGFGCRIFLGHPRWAYATSTTLQDPNHSQFGSYEFGLRAGQRYGDHSGFRFDWLLGPTLAIVDETANVDTYDIIPPDTLVYAYSQRRSITRIAGGGELRLNLGWALGGGHELGLHLGAMILAWNGHEQEPLASDFVHSNIHAWDVGLSYVFLR